MSKTRHIQERMSQRGISQELIDLTLKFGVEQADGKVVLNRQGTEDLLRQLKQLNQAVQRAATKGGLVIVKDEEVLITAYRLDSYRRIGERHS